MLTWDYPTHPKAYAALVLRYMSQPCSAPAANMLPRSALAVRCQFRQLVEAGCQRNRSAAGSDNLYLGRFRASGAVPCPDAPYEAHVAHTGT
jgi:hypothetical protein